MNLINDLLNTLPNGAVKEVRIGAFWTAVVVETEQGPSCGLASTLHGHGNHHHGGGPAVQEAGRLTERSARELAQLLRSTRSPMETAVGMAAVNALLPKQKELWVKRNAEKVIAQHGAGKQVALVGHFPFVSRLREQVGHLWVLEQEPRGKDLPATAAHDVIPRADVVAITGTTLLNHTFEALITLCRPNALVLVLGPSTPLSPVLFDYGVDMLSGSIVENIEAVVRAASQGANFRQVHRHGVQLVTIHKT